MAVQDLNIDGILNVYENEHFYVASFFYDATGVESKPFSDTYPHRARLKIEVNDLNRFGQIEFETDNGLKSARNKYFRYLVSDNLEELIAHYNKVRNEWFNIRREYLVSELEALDKLEKEV